MVNIFVRGPLEDMGDLLAIARVQGKKVLKVKRVKVKPFIHQIMNDYVVVVEPDGSSCSEASDVGSGKPK